MYKTYIYIYMCVCLTITKLLKDTTIQETNLFEFVKYLISS